MSVGWIFVSFFSTRSQYTRSLDRKLILVAMFVALGMAEIVSAIPTSGGPYFWAAILAPPEKAAFFAWITGW